MNKANLKRWRENIVEWAEENLVLMNPLTRRKEPLRLYEHQKDWLREATRRKAEGGYQHKVAVCSWSKREGKTTEVAIICAQRMACFSEQRVGCIANSERQSASNVYNVVVGFFQDSPALAEYVTEDCIRTRKLTVPALGNVMEVYPDNPATVQGIAFDLLACDELHASDSGGKTFAFASQQCDGPGAQVLICSQAGAPVNSNPIWRLYSAREEAHILFDYRQEPVTPWAKQRAEEAKAELLPGEWDYMHRNAWGATGIKLLSAADVEAAAMDYRQPQTREEWLSLMGKWGFAGQPYQIGVGLDRAGVSRTGDATVWTVTARIQPSWEGQDLFRVVRQDLLPTGSEAEVLECDRRTREIFGTPADSILESYGCSDLVEKIPGARLETPTSQKQQGLFNRLHRLIQEGRFGFPAELALFKEELIGFEYDAEREGITKFGTQRGKDDHCYSAAWSIEASDVMPEEQEVVRVFQISEMLTI